VFAHAPLVHFAAKPAPSALTERRREMSARMVDALVEEDQLGAAFALGMELLSDGIGRRGGSRHARAGDSRASESGAARAARRDVPEAPSFRATA
jgi:hypothetical protein